MFHKDLEVWAKPKYKARTWKQWKRDVRSLLQQTDMTRFDSKLRKFMGQDGGNEGKTWNERFQKYFRKCLEADVRASCGASTMALGIFDSGAGVIIWYLFHDFDLCH